MDIPGLIKVIQMALLIIMNVILITNLFILFRAKKRIIVWNFGTVLSVKELKGLFKILSRKKSKLDQHVMIIVYKYKWELYLLDIVSVLSHIKIPWKCRKRKNTDGRIVLGSIYKRWKIVHIYEFNFLNCNTDIERKILFLFTILHELRHYYHHLNKTGLNPVQEEIECFNFARDFICGNIKEFNKILEINEEIKNISIRFDPQELMVVYGEYYGDIISKADKEQMKGLKGSLSYHQDSDRARIEEFAFQDAICEKRISKND